MIELKSCKLDKSKIKRSDVVSITCVHTPGGVNCAQVVEYLQFDVTILKLTFVQFAEINIGLND
jgi:hypothetical protein